MANPSMSIWIGRGSEPHYNNPVPLNRRRRLTASSFDGDVPASLPASRELANGRELSTVADELKEVRVHHDKELFIIQQVKEFKPDVGANVLVLVNFMKSGSKVSCGGTHFDNGTIRLSYQDIEATGSEYLMHLLGKEQHQHSAMKKAKRLFPDNITQGATHFLDLSPTDDENDYISALQNLTLTKGVKLWHRTVVTGTSPLAVSGHDDVCSCMLPISGLLDFDRGYELVEAPKHIESNRGNVCIFDTENWPVTSKIDDFCTTRWAANTIRLFRTIAQPAGQMQLLIDSAPRMWTLVGLFTKLGMTNHDILRDHVFAWFNTDCNSHFIELCPEESLRIGLALKIPSISEPAFRILVNERALEVAGGQPDVEPTRTIFGRQCTSFTGTDSAESISRMIEHASVSMAERYKDALDRVLGDHALDILEVPEWQMLKVLHKVVLAYPEYTDKTNVRPALEKLMKSIQAMYVEVVNTIINCNGSELPSDSRPDFSYHHRQDSDVRLVTVQHMDEMRAFSVPKKELKARPLVTIYDSLNLNQRALTPMLWEGLRTMNERSFKLVIARDRTINEGNLKFVDIARDEFVAEVDRAKSNHHLREPELYNIDKVAHSPLFPLTLITNIAARLRTYAQKMQARDESFKYGLYPHLLLVLDEAEMNFLRLGNEEATFQAEAPETDMGPSGPGPAFHTGRSVATFSDDKENSFERLALSDDDGTSTVVGSMAAQDGISTVYNRRRVLARSSVASEQFTEDGGDCYADAEYEVPAAHQARGQALAQIVEEEMEMDEEDDEAGQGKDVEPDSEFSWESDEQSEHSSDEDQEDIDDDDVEMQETEHVIMEITTVEPVHEEATNENATTTAVREEAVIKETTAVKAGLKEAVEPRDDDSNDYSGDNSGDDFELI